jgi:hypothetical protein
MRLIARATVGAVLAFAVIEAILRFGFGLGNPVLIQSDSACSYVLKPDQDVVRFLVRTRINHLGMRSDEVADAHVPGTLRLLFVGDSITYGTTRVDQKDIFTEVLHRELPAIVHRPVEVLNASAGAWAPDNELSYIESRGIFHSDVVLLVLNDGDLTQPRATIADVSDSLPQKRPLTAIGELWARYIRPRLARDMERKDAGDSVNKKDGKVERENLADLDRLEQFVTSHGAKLSVIYIPFRKDVPQESEPSRSILRAWSNAHHVGFCDLTASEGQYLSENITFDHGIHLNARGHLVVAREIEQFWPELTTPK